ncbi:hypothetical protein PVAP13_8NG027601 [Panicum virgatum]|uniref:Cytochrome P450 90A1 n=1 Tax=Panicum virgatum TaxID=38727 RepID=A0A8T0PAV1_PANVG|nr:hypothetical protein PVAP13_8NG027601 [Panicum virgatum]
MLSKILCASLSLNLNSRHPHALPPLIHPLALAPHPAEAKPRTPTPPLDANASGPPLLLAAAAALLLAAAALGWLLAGQHGAAARRGDDAPHLRLQDPQPGALHRRPRGAPRQRLLHHPRLRRAHRLLRRPGLQPPPPRRRGPRRRLQLPVLHRHAARPALAAPHQGPRAPPPPRAHAHPPRPPRVAAAPRPHRPPRPRHHAAVGARRHRPPPRRGQEDHLQPHRQAARQHRPRALDRERPPRVRQAHRRLLLHPVPLRPPPPFHHLRPGAQGEEESGRGSAGGDKRMDDKVENGAANGKEDDKIEKKDMVEELLEAEGGSFSEEEMVDFCLSLLVAGYETTSVLMTLAVKFLTETPTALAQLRVINETLRVANLISGVFRRANTDIHFKDYIIPKGCKIFASFRAVHLNTEHYENARTFDPWRWQSKNKLQNAEGASLFTPFGGGPRLCPGYELARVVVSVFLHHLVTRFSWEEAEEDRIVFFPTTRTLKGYPINLRRRPDSVF